MKSIIIALILTFFFLGCSGVTSPNAIANEEDSLDFVDDDINVENPLSKNSQTCTYSSTKNTLACIEKTYKTATIGTQVWLAENLSFDAGIGSYCYSGKSAKCDTYGRLYTWSAAMDGATSSSASPSGVQGVCPTGWHLPSDNEWTILNNYVDANNGDNGIGNSLKTTKGWASSGVNATDQFDFSGLPGGYHSSLGGYYYVGGYGNWWSSTEHSITNAYFRHLLYYKDTFPWGFNDKAHAFSVRCLQDAP
jgi:uncharacterized protein (TIGR02145 family)